MIQDRVINKQSKQKRNNQENKSSSIQLRKIKCNLCGKEFKGTNRFTRFCKECKDDNELYSDYI